MEKASLLFPPPYEAPAYPRRRKSRYFIRRLFSVEGLLKSMIAAALLWVLFELNHIYQSHDRNLNISSPRLIQHFDEAVAQCVAIDKFPERPNPQTRDSNPRWTPTNGQKKTVILKNATLFDGESFVSHTVDITFSEGLIVSVSETSDQAHSSDVVVHDLHGRYVTPGLVDMHSHHMANMWPATEVNSDSNEMNPETGAFTPMVRIIDALKAYDIATFHIASGGITTSLIIPGSANIFAGEGTVVKNVMHSGEHGEPVVEDLLLERGIPFDERHRYMKMAYGENPRRVWDYARLGTAWHLREHLQKAKVVKEEQDDYCAAISQARGWSDKSKAEFVQEKGKYPFKLELDSTIGVLRGRVIVQNHNYEPQDMEDMLRISHEFGYRVWGFHHAIEAWQIPELLKDQGDNITIATFAEFSLYKWEAYSPSLYAGHILNKHGVPIAYKSDHSGEEFTSAKYLASQAAVGHAFLLPEEKALQSITSIPAKAIDLDFRVGYLRPGYDADITVWNTHPLNLGATPLQVFIDGQPQLDQKMVEKSMGTSFTASEAEETKSNIKPQMRYEPEAEHREDFCSRATKDGQNFIITGIQKAFLDNYPELSVSAEEASNGPLDLVISDGSVLCLGSRTSCATQSSELKASGNAVEIDLQNGHLFPGLTAVTSTLGVQEIAALPSTGDGEADGQKISDPETLTYAKYGVFLDGKMFARARLGGVTRAISPPLILDSTMVQGVSVEILTSGKKNILDGGIVQGEVALHIFLGEATKGSEGTVSNGIHHIRKMLQDGKGKNNETTYGQVAAGEMPMLVHCNNRVWLHSVEMIH